MSELLERYREIRANCAARKETLPSPPEPFRARVDELLAEAYVGALLAMPNPVVVHIRHGSRWGIDQEQTVRRSIGHRCAGCGCDYDDKTEGCDNCASRHAMRRRSRRALLEAA